MRKKPFKNKITSRYSLDRKLFWLLFEIAPDNIRVEMDKFCRSVIHMPNLSIFYEYLPGLENDEVNQMEWIH